MLVFRQYQNGGVVRCHIGKHARCIKQLVLIAVKNAKFHSSLIQVGQSIVEIVIVSGDLKEDLEDIKLTC